MLEIVTFPTVEPPGRLRVQRFESAVGRRVFAYMEDFIGKINHLLHSVLSDLAEVTA